MDEVNESQQFVNFNVFIEALLRVLVAFEVPETVKPEYHSEADSNLKFCHAHAILQTYSNQYLYVSISLKQRVIQ